MEDKKTNDTITVKDDVSFGSALAMAISYVNWHSIGWAIFQKQLSHHFVHQLLIAVHMVILHCSAADGGKQLLCAVDLCLFDRSEIQAVHGAFGFRNKINVADSPFMEYDSPVR